MYMHMYISHIYHRKVINQYNKKKQRADVETLTQKIPMEVCLLNLCLETLVSLALFLASVYLTTAVCTCLSM